MSDDNGTSSRPSSSSTPEWDKRTEAWASQKPLPKDARVDPKNVRFELGPMMTEEQFRAWQQKTRQARQGGR
jgi:hypothetical protein